VELGELLDTAGLLPADWAADEYDAEDDDDAASSASAGSGLSGVAGGPRGAGAGGGGAGAGDGPQGGEGAGGGGGSGFDSHAAMMFRPRRLRALKRRYEQLLRVALQVGLGHCMAPC
jgi:hypothetical protein